MPQPGPDAVFEALRATFPVATGSRGMSRLVDIRRAGDEAVLVFRWPPRDRLFGVPLSLTRTHRRLDWDHPAEDLQDWLESVDLWLMDDVENGFTYRGRRRTVSDYIELREPPWPSDPRFYLQSNPRVEQGWTLLEDSSLLEMDPGAALSAQESGHLLSWIYAYENNSTGMPIVGHSTVIKAEDPYVARIVDLAIGDLVPATVVVDLIRHATHAAAEAGARLVVTDLDLGAWHPDLAAITGFRISGNEMSVDTDFLAEDPQLADRLLDAVMTDPGRWGGDRDRSGRYLPTTRTGRLLHRIKHGDSGRPPQVFTG